MGQKQSGTYNLNEQRDGQTNGEVAYTLEPEISSKQFVSIRQTSSNSTLNKTDSPKLITVSSKSLADSVKPIADFPKLITVSSKSLADSVKPIPDSSNPIVNIPKPIATAIEPIVITKLYYSTTELKYKPFVASNDNQKPVKEFVTNDDIQSKEQVFTETAVPVTYSEIDVSEHLETGSNASFTFYECQEDEDFISKNETKHVSEYDPTPLIASEVNLTLKPFNNPDVLKNITVYEEKQVPTLITIKSQENCQETNLEILNNSLQVKIIFESINFWKKC